MRYALRSLLRTPAFSLTVVLTIALGIGAATAVFSVVDRLLFRDLPYADGERLVSFGLTAPILPAEFMLGADYYVWRGKQTPFEGMTTLAEATDCDLTEGSPVRMRCGRVEANMLSVLGVNPLIGRNFTSDEDLPNVPKAALLSYGLWKSRFAGDPAVSGRTFSLDGQTATVIGVLPQDFELPTQQSFDLLIPQALDPTRQQRPATGAVLRAFARLKPGTTPERATAELGALFQDSLRFVPPNFRKEVKLRVRSLAERQRGDARLASIVLLGAVMAVLLIACANVANLLLARTVSRSREWAVRLALGASKLQVLRQTLSESMLLSLAGGVAGCLLASLLLELFTKLAPQGLPGLERASLDTRVLLFALGASLLCGVVFSLAPAFYRARATNTTPRRMLFREGLVVAQIALSLVLVLSATLLMRTFYNLTSAPLGMNTDKVLTASVVLGQSRYSQPAQRWQFFEQLESKLKGAPGIEVLAVSDTVPPAGIMRARPYATFVVEGQPPFTQGTGGMVGWRAVTPGYLQAFGIPVVKGRGFREEDRGPNENAVVLSSLLAARLFPSEEPIGKRLRFFEGPWYTIIGISGDVKNGGITAKADPEYYVVRKHTPDDPGRAATVIIRSPLPSAQLAQWVRSEVAALDPTLPVAIESMTERIGNLAAGPRFQAALLSLFALTGLALAAVGLYGVIAYLVSQRTQEIGVRIAIGATPANIRNLLLTQAARWTALGVLFGLAGCWWATQWIYKLLYNVPARDPLTFALAILALIGVALLGAWLPARRAARIDPATALRL